MQIFSNKLEQCPLTLVENGECIQAKTPHSVPVFDLKEPSEKLTKTACVSAPSDLPIPHAHQGVLGPCKLVPPALGSAQTYHREIQLLQNPAVKVTLVFRILIYLFSNVFSNSFQGWSEDHASSYSRGDRHEARPRGSDRACSVCVGNAGERPLQTAWELRGADCGERGPAGAVGVAGWAEPPVFPWAPPSSHPHVQLTANPTHYTFQTE